MKENERRVVKIRIGSEGELVMRIGVIGYVERNVRGLVNLMFVL